MGSESKTLAHPGVPGTEATSPEFDRYSDEYARLLKDPVRDRFASDPTFFHSRKWMVIRDFLSRQRLDPATLSWLDAGCGQGDLLKLAGPNFRRATGCDPSPKMIAHATAEVHGQPSHSELPFPDQSFDLVTAVCVYHHVHELENRVLLTASVRRVLKPHGLFCLMEHNPLNPVTRLICRRCPLDRDAQLVRAKIAAGLVRSAGLEVVETAYFLYFPKAVFRYARRLEECLRGLPLGGQYALFARRPAPRRADQSIPRPDETE